MVYLIGSMRNPRVPEIANYLRAQGHDIFDDWYSPGENADPSWQAYEKERGRTFAEALRGAHAQEVFNFDKRHLDAASAVVLICPAGKSAHLELGYVIGTGKPGYIFMEQEPERFDVMFAFATAVTTSLNELEEILEDYKDDQRSIHRTGLRAS